MPTNTMSAQILHEQIIKCYQNFIKTYRECRLDVRDLVASRASYNLGVATIFAQNASASHGQCLLQYFFSESIELKLKTFLKSIQQLKSKDTEKFIESIQTSMQSIASTVENMKEDQTTTVRGSIKCMCGATMTHEQETASLVCPKCGVMQMAYGLVADEGEKSKRNTNYMPTSHATNWLLKIQGHETCDSKELAEVAALVRAQAASENTPIHQLTCDAIRRYLRILHKAAYNDHIPAIRTRITNIRSPTISSEVSATIINYFDIAMRIYNRTRPGPQNAPYHPFFLYKIIEQPCIDIPPQDKKRLLENIHLQASRTLRQNDNIWREICKEIPLFVFTTTSR